jgi:hypothetical protein
MIARLYPSDAPARAAAAAFVDAGYRESDVVVLTSGSQPAPAAEGEAPAPAAGVDMETAVRAGKMLGEQADFYLSRLTDGRALVVATPPFMESRVAEEILDANGPLPDSHLPPKKEFVPFSEQDTPFSNMLGWPTKSESDTPFSDLLGFGFKEEGLSHLSRMFPPLASDFTFSSKMGMGFKAKKDTFFGASTKSNRLEGKSSSFGMGFKAGRETPFSSMLGLPVLTKRKHFLTSEYKG